MGLPQETTGLFVDDDIKDALCRAAFHTRSCGLDPECLEELTDPGLRELVAGGQLLRL